MGYQSSGTGGRPNDPAASGDAGRCTRKQAGINRFEWAGAGERRHSRSEPGTPVIDTDDADCSPEQSINTPDINLISSCSAPEKFDTKRGSIHFKLTERAEIEF